MPILQRITDDIKNAMRERNKVALNTLRALKSAITNATIDKPGTDAQLTENEVINIIRKQIKQRQESINQFTQAGRDELASNEKEEVQVLDRYLPKAMSEQEVIAVVEQVIAELGVSSKREMGNVMKALQEKTGGRADGKQLSQEVMKRLA